MSLLERILSAKRAELPDLGRRRLPPPPALRPVNLRRGPGDALRLIAEIKRRSPSAGALSTKLSVSERARVYEASGASMISVLCDSAFFDGEFEHLAEARRETTVPLLAKEFVIDERQLDAARAYGASAVLLIARCLPPERLAALALAARERELTPIVEVFDEAELAVALQTASEVIGVNARDLDTLEMDSAAAARVAASIPKSRARAQFSGTRAPEQVVGLSNAGLDAALVGQVLMEQDDPAPLLRQLTEAAARAAR